MSTYLYVYVHIRRSVRFVIRTYWVSYIVKTVSSFQKWPLLTWSVNLSVGYPPPKFNSSPLKNGDWKTTFLLGR